MATSPYNYEDDFDLPRQTTHCRVLVHSHIVDNDCKGLVDCSLDVISCQVAKTIKGGGTAAFIMVPRRNYLNYIFPNDWVNIYFDPGDGRGFIRTFFGFVDRIERSITVSGEGISSTQYHVSCSDFTKAFDKTHIYFNPHIADRQDFVGQFAGTKNLAGALLRTKGIVAYGSPADIVMNIAHVMMGFGAQFVAPPTYPLNGAYLEASRKARLKWVKSRFSKGVQEIVGGSTITDWINKLKSDAAMAAVALKKGDVDAATGYLTAAPGVSKEEVRGMIAAIHNKAITSDNPQANPENFSDQILLSTAIEQILKQNGLTSDFLNSADVKSGLAVEATALPGVPGHLLDLIDFSFVEYEAIDGSIVSTPIWTQQGTLWSIMMSYSNDMINELFCDLRPLGEDYKSNPLASGGYTHDPDENGYAPTDIANSTAPVRFAPALIMREYPFNTIDSMYTAAEVLGQEVGTVPFGAIFSMDPGIPGRKINDIPVLNDYLREENPDMRAIKHLDVVSISVRDIISEHVGRGDADIQNMLELYSDGFMGKHMKFICQDIQPISNPISVARNGLRVRTYTTRFGRFSSKIQKNQGIDNVGTRRKLIRWVLMLDHWYQHNIEYLHGTMTFRAFPEIRVGYRLDIEDRHESYYVEGVNHNWNFPEPMTTSVTVSRGQRYDPYPVYIKPATPACHGERSSDKDRLAMYFKPMDTEATIRAFSMDPFDRDISNVDKNIVDDPDMNKWGKNAYGYLIALAHETGNDIVTAEELDDYYNRVLNNTAAPDWKDVFKKGTAYGSAMSQLQQAGLIGSGKGFKK